MVENNEAQMERVEIAVATPRRFGRGAKFSCRKKASGCRLHATRRNDGRCVGKRCDLQQAPVTTFEQFGDVRIFRPSHGTESFIRRRARNHLLSRFSPGEYRGAEAANAVIQHQFKFYENMLQPMVPQLASRGAAEFLLFQYDEAWRLIHGKGILDLRERERWERIEPNLKRAIKYLVELICLTQFNSGAKPTREEALFATESALVCAESMAQLSHESDLAHAIFPDDCVVRVYDSEPLDYKISVEGRFTGYDRAFSDRIIRDRNSRNRFVDFPQFDHHTPTHQKYLDEPFTQSFGMSYGEFIYAIRAVIEGSQPSLHPQSFPTLFVNRARVLEEIKKFNPLRPSAAIERAIEGFSVSPAALKVDKRVVWNPKQESRAYRRGFFVFPHESGHHLAFSREMAKESLMQLVFWVCFKRLPAEWRTPETLKALDGLSLAASEWFEGIICRNLQSLGILGQRRHRTIGSGHSQIQIPDAVGEIDFLGYHAEQNLLVLAEAKMVMTGLEARYWRDDLDEFVFRSGSYAERFRRKLTWVAENRHAISAALGFSPAVEVGCAMLTLYPCIARAFIPDFPCVSVTEFMLDYERARRWPYLTVK
jgi:hypothetical protein